MSFRLPTLLLTLLSIALNLAILGCAARTLAVFNAQKETNVYFLPVWNQHFDTRELAALIGTSTAIFLLNAVSLAGLFVEKLPSNILLLASSSLSAILSLVAIIFTSVLNGQSTRDTLQTWTCRWRSINDDTVPRSYDTLCHETRFAFYTTIPSFIIQLLLLSLALYSLFLARPAVNGVRFDEEKGAHELGSVRQQHSFETSTRLGTPKSMNDSVRYMGAAKA